jgi:XTP/dITP diphosphohydrolase
MENKRVILASGNKGKLLELQAILGDLSMELIPQPQTNEYEVEETGTTFVENAIIKARHASRLSGLPSIADDSGLIVERLLGMPGVNTARYAGSNCSSSDNIKLLLKNLAPHTELKHRVATFICVLVYLKSANDPLPVIAIGQWQGAIATATSGEDGFGYDPVFWDFESGMTAAQMTKQQKSQCSHRGKACRLLKQKLNQL